MFGIENLWLFVLSGLLLNLIPGPDSLLIASRAASQGFKAGSAAALGIGTGTMIHIVAAALGLSAVLATSATAFTVVKVLGGVYLIYMAFSMLRSNGGDEKPVCFQKSKASFKRIYTQGLMTNVFNPKIAVFFLAFMPQFISASSEHKALAFIVLGLIFNVNGMLWCHLLAWGSASLSNKLQVNNSVKKWLSRLTATLFGVFGVRLLVASQY
ncbi:LysE family translocator [Photobacterium sp. 1_MG-2023]|uniref:LysE family translocator n=1 Tax=Photobacterium sp. 1_MG-2023 TaxID=3062646 RepID=UPI0026E1D3A4|nr:LysE family translocator [Photobacterium sp. 1_MG-2023]MDO6708135.1 LysE family translocator [Photobacterium sp. 1_MG-2023]